MLEFEEFLTNWILWVIRNCAKSLMTRETLYLIILIVSFHIPLPTLYKPSLPMKCKKKKESLQEASKRENFNQTLES